MRIGVSALCLLAVSVLGIPGGPAKAAPVSPHALAAPAGSLVQTVGHRTYHRRHGHYRKHGYRHRKSRAGWFPAYREHPHLPGRWSHAHCHDWHRCHYYFYGYRQWEKWNPGRSRAEFRRRYHH